jgi:hypothetical protein
VHRQRSIPRSTNLVLALSVLLLLGFWSSRLMGIDRFPPFLDETIHINISEQGYRISPLIYADLGRVFTGWWHMLFQTHAAGSIWIARTITVLAALPGVAAIMGIGRLAAGAWGALFAGLLYLFSTYHLFFERLALADPLANAAVSVALYFTYRLAYRANLWDAVIAGIFLFVAFGTKVSTILFYGIPIAGALTLRPYSRSWLRQMRWLGAAFATEISLTILFVVGLWMLGHDVLSNSLALATTNRQQATTEQLATTLSIARIGQNMINTISALAAYLGPVALGLCLGAVVILIVRRRFFLPLCLVGPALAMWISRPQEMRYWVVSVAILLLCGGIVLAESIRQRGKPVQIAVLSLVLGWGILQSLPFALTAATEPAKLNISAMDYRQYVASDAAGFGLLEVHDFLRTEDVQEVIGVLANCNGLLYLAQNDFTVICPRVNPNGEDIQPLIDFMASNRTAGIYVVLEDSPYVPKTAPGRLLVVIERPSGRANLAIYDLSPQH